MFNPMIIDSVSCGTCGICGACGACPGGIIPSSAALVALDALLALVDEPV